MGSVESIQVHGYGIEGDWQSEKVDADFGGHGGPLKAVCCWSRDLVDQLKSEGHPLDHGACGENILFSGLDWSQVVPGSRIEVGEVLLEVTQYSRPCYKQGSNFTRGQYMRINHMSKPGSSRVYCAVLKRGSIRVGDKTILHVDTLGAKDYRNNADV